MRPPGHSGKAKRGHLCFDASFESGNLGRVDLINETEYDLFIRPDTCNPKLRFWFNFTVDNVKQDQVRLSNNKKCIIQHLLLIILVSIKAIFSKVRNKRKIYSYLLKKFLVFLDLSNISINF